MQWPQVADPGFKFRGGGGSVFVDLVNGRGGGGLNKIIDSVESWSKSNFKGGALGAPPGSASEMVLECS